MGAKIKCKGVSLDCTTTIDRVGLIAARAWLLIRHISLWSDTPMRNGDCAESLATHCLVECVWVNHTLSLIGLCMGICCQIKKCKTYSENRVFRLSIVEAAR